MRECLLSVGSAFGSDPSHSRATRVKTTRRRYAWEQRSACASARSAALSISIISGRRQMLARSPWHKALAVFIIALVPILAIAVPAWCFGSGMW